MHQSSSSRFSPSPHSQISTVSLGLEQQQTFGAHAIDLYFPGRPPLRRVVVDLALRRPAALLLLGGGRVLRRRNRFRTGFTRFRIRLLAFKKTFLTVECTEGSFFKRIFAPTEKLVPMGKVSA
jgi:hypothetical protein